MATRFHYLLMAAAAILLLLGLARQHDQVIDTIKQPWQNKQGENQAPSSETNNANGQSNSQGNSQSNNQSPPPTSSTTNSKSRPSFKELGEKYGTDKVTDHHYWFMYDKYLDHLRGKKIKMLEIGLGCNMAYGPGKSYNLWLEYFPNVDLYYIEYDAACAEKWKGKTTGAQIFTGDQADRNFLRKFVAEAGMDFDVVIDDGGHSVTQQSTSLEELWKIVKPGGVYFIEDLQTSYIGHYGGDASGTDTKIKTMTKMIYEIIDDKMTDGSRNPLSKEMRNIDCMREVCAFTKKETGTV